MIKKTFNLLKYISEYYLNLKKNYKISSKINFGSVRANQYFINKVRKSKGYFEIGSGSSTLYVKNLKKKYISIESSKSFYNCMRQKKLNIIYCDIGPTKYFSFPIYPFFFIKKKIKLYSESINFFIKKYKQFPDLILIDGRYRVLCVLTIIEIFLNKNYATKSIIIIDDFVYRKNYQSLKKIINIKTYNRFGIINLNKKIKINKIILQDFKKKYNKSAI